MARPDAMGEVLALYQEAPLAVKAFIRGRNLLSQMEFVERFVPYAGEIVDLGCGHGLFSNLMALGSGHRMVTGIDLDERKIAVARDTVLNRPNIKFIPGDVTRLPLPPCDAVTIVDVLYLMPAAAQQQILMACAKILKPGGLLIWKAQERRPRWKYYLTYMQEYITTNMGVTKGKRGSLHFMGREEALEAIAAAGMIAEAVDMRTPLPYTDILYLGKKPGKSSTSGS